MDFSPKYDRRFALLLFAATFLCGAVFFSTGRWAQTAHDDLTWAIVEQGSFRIDAYITDAENNINTGDWAKHDGHYYSNKAPGVSFPGALVYAPLYYGEKHWFGEGKIPVKIDVWNLWIINLFCSVLPFALCSVLIFKILRGFGYSIPKSAMIAELTALCTPLWPYSAMNWAHPMAACCLTAAACLLLKHHDTKEGRREISLPLAEAGAFCGLAFLTDYGAGAALPAFVWFAFRKYRRQGVSFLLGAVPVALLFCWYHAVCFGSPFAIASFFNNPQFIEAEKAGGIFGHLSGLITAKLLIGAERGILWGSPFLAGALFGIIHWWKEGEEKRMLCIFMGLWIILPLLANSGFNGWHGGASICARYLICTLPAWGILAAGCPLKNALSQAIFAVAAVLSWLNMLVITAVTPLSSEGVNPIYGNAYRIFFQEFNALKIFSFSRVPGDLNGVWSAGRILGGGAAMDLIFMFAVAAILPFVIVKMKCGEMKCRIGDYVKRWGGEFHLSCRKAVKRIPPELAFSLLIGMTILLLFPARWDEIIWANDEPMLIREALYASQDGHWCTHGIIGSFGVSYGAFPLWIYQFLMMFTCSLPMIALLKTILLGGGCIVLFYAICRECRPKGKQSFVSILTWMFVSSPWLWNYTRCLWDNIFLMILSAAVLYCMARYLKSKKILPLFLSACFTVIAIWTHSMAAPLAGGIAIFLLIFRHDLWKTQRRNFLICGIPAALIACAILLIRFTGKTDVRSNDFGMQASFWEALYHSCKFFKVCTSSSFLPYYVPNTDIAETSQCSFFSSAGTILFIITVGAGVFFIIKKRKEHSVSHNVALLSCCILFVHIVFFTILRVEIYPHYHIGVVVPCLVVAWYALVSCIDNDSSRPVVPLLRYLLISGFVITTALSFHTVYVFSKYIDTNNGTTDYQSFGPTLAAQWQSTEALNKLLAAGYTLNITYGKEMPYEDYPRALEVLREMEDLAHPRTYQPLNGETCSLHFSTAPIPCATDSKYIEYQ